MGAVQKNQTTSCGTEEYLVALSLAFQSRLTLQIRSGYDLMEDVRYCCSRLLHLDVRPHLVLANTAHSS